jgi:hypothetical protein
MLVKLESLRFILSKAYFFHCMRVAFESEKEEASQDKWTQKSLSSVESFKIACSPENEFAHMIDTKHSQTSQES